MVGTHYNRQRKQSSVKRLSENAGETGNPASMLIKMNIFERYNHSTGTHCWFCNREYEVDKNLYIRRGSCLRRTREHIVPKSQVVYNIPKNYIGSCDDCNCLKGNKNAKQFALMLDRMILDKSHLKHALAKYIPLMRDRAWKLYNKTSNLHKSYKKTRLR